METYERILVPLDGSPLAEQVFPYVRTVARRLWARVELLRVFDPVPPALADPSHGLYLDRIAAGRREEARDYLEAVAASLGKDGLRVSCTVREGSPAACIVGEAGKEPATLIAMSTHGRSGMTRWVLGSVTEKVLHAAATPLLIIRSRPQPVTPEAKLETVIVPLDGSSLAEQILPHATALATLLELKVALIMVTLSEGDYYQYARSIAATYRDLSAKANADALGYLTGMRRRLEREGIGNVEAHLLHGHPAVAITDYARNVSNNLVALTTHGRSGVGRWVLGSVADRVVRDSGDPVLVTRAVKE